MALAHTFDHRIVRSEIRSLSVQNMALMEKVERLQPLVASSHNDWSSNHTNDASVGTVESCHCQIF
jgi:hypothetical protein